MQSALLVVALSLSSVGCHHRSACVSGARHGCYGGCYSQARHGGCYGGGYSGGWVQPASYPQGVYRGGSYGVAPSGQAMAAPSGQSMGYAPTSGFSAGSYGMAGTQASWPTYGYNTGSYPSYGMPAVNTYGANYGYTRGRPFANFGRGWSNAYNAGPNAYSQGYGMPGSGPYYQGYGNYPGYGSPYGGMYGPGTYSSAYGPAPLTQQVINAGRATGLLPSQGVNNAAGAVAAPRGFAAPRPR
ncbi:MAG: hypothetical protein U0790_18010 [Isosphaeraceae bacterium]